MPGYHTYVLNVMFSVYDKTKHNLLLFSLNLLTYVELTHTHTHTVYVHPRACQSQTLHYKWVYAAVIYCNEIFLKMFSSFYPKAHKVISSVMQTPTLIMSTGYDSTASE